MVLPLPIPPGDDLAFLPRPPRPGLYLACGEDIIPRALRALAAAFAPQTRLIWIDAANQFDAHWVAQSARVFHRNPQEVLRAFTCARPFTAFQLEAMTADKLLPAARQSGALLAVIAGPLGLYEEAEDQNYSTRRSFERFTEALRRLSQDLALLLLIPNPKPTPYARKIFSLGGRLLTLGTRPGIQAAGERSSGRRGG